LTKREKTQFVKQLLKTLEDRMVEDIEKDRVPENWDGTELRWWTKYRANAVVMGDTKGKRYKEYENTVLVNNL
jgi:hypothetical protein